jgi:hypothetical protein
MTILFYQPISRNIRLFIELYSYSTGLSFRQKNKRRTPFMHKARRGMPIDRDYKRPILIKEKNHIKYGEALSGFSPKASGPFTRG